MNHWISQLSVTMVPQDLVEPLNKLSSSGADSMRSASFFFFFFDGEYLGCLTRRST